MILNYHKTERGQEMERSIKDKVNRYLKTEGMDRTV